MSLQISEFVGIARDSSDIFPVADGAPVRVTNAAGAFMVGGGTIVIRISGTGTITWPGVATPENFAGGEYRRVRPGDTFTVSA